MSPMRRTIAIALAVGLLFAGGCGRQERRNQRPPAVSTQTTQDAPAAATGGTGSGSGTSTATDDVDQLLDQAGQQLSGDAQPADDED